MYIVVLQPDVTVEEYVTIHGEDRFPRGRNADTRKQVRLESGKIVKGINTIDSFTFTIYPNSPGFDIIQEFSTHVHVFNTNKNDWEFIGRVLYVESTMDEEGLITKTVTCESILGYLCDSVQAYKEPMNHSLQDLVRTMLNCHNAQVESYKQIKMGNVPFLEYEDFKYTGIQRESTWDSFRSKVLGNFGGEIQLRKGYTDGGAVYGTVYLDYYDRIGETKTTEIALSENMKSVTRENEPTSYITRLIPLGCQLKETDTETGEEVETELRLDITSVNNGLEYIDDKEAIALYGIHVGIVEWDDVTVASNLLRKGQEWLKENNKVTVKYTITALDLSLIGLAVDDFEVGNVHPIKNDLLGIDDFARIIKKTIDICDETASTIEVGDSLKTMSDIQREQAAQIKAATDEIKSVSYSTSYIDRQIAALSTTINTTAKNLKEEFQTEIAQFGKSIDLKVSGSLGSKASIILSAGTNEMTGEFDLSQIRQAFADDPTAISISAGTLTFNSNTIIINSTNFTLDAEGKITATAGEIGGWTLKSYKLYAGDGVDIKTVCVQAPTENNLYVFAAGGTSHDSYADCPFRVTKAGKLYATDAIVYGDIITIDGSFKTELDRGSMRLYFDDVLCGTINTKYWTGAATEGISLRVEEGGNYIMFSHADDTQGSGYVVDYYLNAGWSSNYDEMHIFQTSARFLDKVYFSGSGAYFRAAYLYNNSYIRSVDSDDNVGEEMLGYDGTYVDVGSVGCATMLRGTTVYLKNTSTTVTSDRNAKNSIEELPEAYESFLDALAPVRYKYNDGKSGRYHVGYIAQDVEAALTAAGLSTADFAGYVDIEGTGELGLAYDEFIALLHKKIKRLESRISELESVQA